MDPIDFYRRRRRKKKKKKYNGGQWCSYTLLPTFFKISSSVFSRRKKLIKSKIMHKWEYTENIMR